MLIWQNDEQMFLFQVQFQLTEPQVICGPGRGQTHPQPIILNLPEAIARQGEEPEQGQEDSDRKQGEHVEKRVQAQEDSKNHELDFKRREERKRRNAK